MSAYRRYSQSIPVYLQNRPRDMVNYYLEKLSLAESEGDVGIRMPEAGKFKVCSFDTVTKESYTVSFGNDELMPSCSCLEWGKSAYLCKHFFAVFKRFPSWSWNAVSSLYRNSPFLTLDYDISNIGKLDVSMERNDSADNDNIFDNMSDNANTLADEDIEDYNDIEAKAHVSCGRREGSVFREVLDDMRRMSFLLESQPKLLQEMCKNLDKIRKSMYEEAPKEKGIMINSTVADPGQTQH
eukprot:gene18369-20216_t